MLSIQQAPKPYNGWMIETDELIQKQCINCNVPLHGRSFFCQEKKILICKNCEYEIAGNICKSTEEEHEHFHLLGIKSI